VRRSLEGQIEELQDDLEELEERENPTPKVCGVVELPAEAFDLADKAARTPGGRFDIEEYFRYVGMLARAALTPEQRRAFGDDARGLLVLPKKLSPQEWEARQRREGRTH
jgi:hypothetical protein